MSSEKPSSWTEKPKFKEFDYFGWIRENLGPTKKNRKDFWSIARLPTVVVVSLFACLVWKHSSSNDWPSRPGDRWYKDMNEKIREQDEEYRRTHPIWPDGKVIDINSKTVEQASKPVEYTNTKKTSTQKSNKQILQRIKRIGQ